MSPWIFVILGAVLLMNTAARAQKPVAELPRVYIDTTWNLPQGGKTWSAHTSADLTAALAGSTPGDVIVLDAGATYSGSFQITAKTNPSGKWIYVISNQLANLPAGKRVAPADVANMPKLVTPNVGNVFQINAGFNHWRFAGLEITANGNYPTGCGVAGHPNCLTYSLIGPPSGTLSPEPDSFTIDRCYIHGSPTVDLQRAVSAQVSTFAVVDSYISDIHGAGMETQGIAAWWTPGPIKIVNNYIEASTENILLGGAGGPATPWVPSDIEIRNNYIFKPLSWVVNSCCVIKNSIEFKSAQRALVTGNTIENMWAHAQNGFAIVLTPRPSQSGDIAVVSDITITNNLLKNVVAGFNTLAKDDVCGTASYAKCNNAGSMARIYIANNLIIFCDPKLPGGARNEAWQLATGADRITTPGTPIQAVPSDIVFQHNTMVSAASTPCWNSITFTAGKAPVQHITNNIWILDNILCRPPTGEFQLQGNAGLTAYMGDPSAAPYDLGRRFYGNVIFVPADNNVQRILPHNLLTAKPFHFVDPAKRNYDLLQPRWTDTSDGKLAGVDSSALPQ